jgi:oligopeptidase B
MFEPARKIKHLHENHGDVREDSYFWMRERDTQPVMDFLKQENERTHLAMEPVRTLETGLYHEMRARIKEDDSSVPVPDSGYFYYSRYATGQEYEIHCRKKGSLEAAEEVILDENQMSREHKYFEVAQVQTSPDQKLLAFAVDTVGRRIHDIFIKDLTTGQQLPDKIEAVTANFVWAADNKTLFYVRQDPETLRSYQLFRYELGGKQELVYEEKDTTFNIGVGISKNNQLLVLAIDKRDSAEWRTLDALTPKGEWKTFLPREDDHEYSLIDASGGEVYILTNWKAPNFRLMRAPLTAEDKTQWSEVIPHDSKVYIESVDAFSKFLVISERENGLTQIRLKDRADGSDRLLKFPDPAYEVGAFSLPDYDSSFVRFKYESLVQPPSVYDEEVVSQARTLRKVREVPGYNPELYESKRLWAKAKDGSMVPMSILMRKGLKLDGGNPTLLYGYGSYGLTTDIYFRSSALSLVDRGFVFVLAHIRGGSEMGREWYEQGRLKYKMNTFTDFIACAETLIADKYTSKQHLHIMGGSAGGLLMGAVLNLRPDLFKGAVAAVPFVDVLTSMLDETIPLTTGEYKEWGDPRIAEQYRWMKEYSPYDNVQKKDYPNILITTGYHDSQVQYWEPAKWTARLRELKTDKNLLLLYTELQAGHSGASGRFEALKTLAKEYAFILMLEGIRE